MITIACIVLGVFLLRLVFERACRTQIEIP
jgi:hypothetical protein